MQEFGLRLMDNIFSLHAELKNKTYTHGGYKAFNISDPKPRNIHKASVRDRLLHHAIYRVLYPYFDKHFIYDSYSCRIGKGTHKAMDRFRSFARKVSKNNTRTCSVLKCDIRKFFASIDHAVLMEIIRKHISDEDVVWLVGKVIESFSSSHNVPIFSRTLECPKYSKGLPLGNLTSQLLVNVYMNEFDQFVKRELKEKYYIRYADDFVFLSQDKNGLAEVLQKVSLFFEEKLKLSLHPDKIFIKTFSSGVDFLGWVHFPDHRVLRGATKRRMFKKLSANLSEASVASYLGILKHGNGYKLKQRISAVLRDNPSP